MSGHYSPRAQSVAAVIPAGVSIDDYVSTAASAFGSGFKKHALSAAKSPVEMLGLDLLAAKAYALAGGESKILNYISSSAEKISQSYESGSISHDQLCSAVASASKGRAFIQREIGKELVKRGVVEEVSDIYAASGSRNIGGVTVYGIKEGDGVIKNLANIWEEKRNWNPRAEFWSAGLYSSTALAGAGAVASYYARRVLAGGAIGGAAEAVKETTGSDFLSKAAQKVGSLAAFSPTFGALSIAAEGLYRGAEKSQNATVRKAANIAANTIEAYMAFAVSRPGLEAAGNIVADTFTPHSAHASEQPFVPNTPKEIADVVSHALNPKNNIIGDAGGRQIVQYTPTPEPTPTIVAQASPTPDSVPELKSLPAPETLHSQFYAPDASPTPEASAAPADKSLEVSIKDATKASTLIPDAGKESAPTSSTQLEKPAEPTPTTHWYDAKENLDKLNSLGVKHDNGSFTYSVQKGDTLSGILTRLDRNFSNPNNSDPVYKGHEAYKEALELGKIGGFDANHLKIGQRIDLSSVIELDSLYNEGKASTPEQKAEAPKPHSPKETFSKPVEYQYNPEKNEFEFTVADQKMNVNSLLLGWDKNNDHKISPAELSRYDIGSGRNVIVHDHLKEIGEGKVAFILANIEEGKVNAAWYKNPSIAHDKVELPKTWGEVAPAYSGARSLSSQPVEVQHADGKISTLDIRTGVLASIPSKADSLFVGFDGNSASGEKNGRIDSYEFDRYKVDSNGTVSLDGDVRKLIGERKVTLLAADVDDAGNIHRVDVKLAANARTNYPTSANLYHPVSIHDTKDNSVINVPKTDMVFKRPLPEMSVYLDLNKNSNFDEGEPKLSTSIHGNTLTINKQDLKTDMSGEIDIPLRVHSPIWEKYMWNGDAIGVLSADIKPSLSSRVYDFFFTPSNAEEMKESPERSTKIETGDKSKVPSEAVEAPTPDPKPAEPQKWLETEAGKAQLEKAGISVKDGHINYTYQKGAFDNVLQGIDRALSNSTNADDVLDEYESHRIALELGKQQHFNPDKIKPGTVIDLTSVIDRLYLETGKEEPITGVAYKGLYVERANTIHLGASSALKAAEPTHYVVGIDSNNNHKYESSEVKRFEFDRGVDTKIPVANLNDHDYFIGAVKVDGGKTVYIASVSAPHVKVVAPEADVAPEAPKVEVPIAAPEPSVDIKAEDSGERVFEWAADKMEVDLSETKSMDELNEQLRGNPEVWTDHAFSALMTPLNMVFTPFAGLDDVVRHSVNGKPLDALAVFPKIIVREGQNLLYLGEDLSHVVIPDSNDF